MEPLEKQYCKEVRKSRHLFLRAIDPHRGDLFKFCRSLTRSPWDAEDLVQETITRAYAKLSEIWLDGIANPKAYLFRIATHLWFDQCRRSGLALSLETHDLSEPTASPEDRIEIREALTAMLTHLPPKERVALLLKDVFDYALDEIAPIMETSEGAVKSALFRGRAKLTSLQAMTGTSQPVYRQPSALLMDQLVRTFNARDMDGMISLFLEHASAEVYGTVQEWNRDEIRRGSMAHTIYDGSGKPLPAGYPSARIFEVFGERVLVILEKGDIVDDVLRYEEEDGKFARFTSYYFCPEVLGEVAALLRMPVNTHAYYLYRE